MAPIDFLQFIIIGVYLFSSVLFFIGAGLKNERLRHMASLLAVGGFVAQSVSLFTFLSEGIGPLLRASFYASFIAWVLVGLWFFLWWKVKSRFLGIVVLPLALLLQVASLATGGIKVTIPPQLTGLFFGLHIGSLAITLGLLALGFGAGLTWLHINRKLKTKAALTSMDGSLPSLSIFDNVNHWTLLFGFPLYTLGIFSSFVWYWIDPEKVFSWDIMKLTSFGVWLFFAFAFHQRIILGWKGRKPALIAIWLFLFMAMSLAHHTISFKP